MTASAPIDDSTSSIFPPGQQPTHHNPPVRQSILRPNNPSPPSQYHQPPTLPCQHPGNATSSTNTSTPAPAPPALQQATSTPLTPKAMAIHTDDTFPTPTSSSPRESSRALATLRASLPVIRESECEAGALAAALSSLSLSSTSSSASSSPGSSEPSSPRPRYAQPRRVHWDADIMELDEKDEEEQRKALSTAQHHSSAAQRTRRSRRSSTTLRGQQERQARAPAPPTSRYFQQKKRSSGSNPHVQTPKP